MATIELTEARVSDTDEEAPKDNCDKEYDKEVAALNDDTNPRTVKPETYGE